MFVKLTYMPEIGLVLAWVGVLVVSGLGWQLLRQNGRILLRLEDLEARLDELEFGDAAEPEGVGDETADQPRARPHPQPLAHPMGESDPRSDVANHANRFGNRSLARSRIKRDGLKAGTPAPDFRLPRLDGHGDLTLGELQGRRVLLVFSSPGCGPCLALAPRLEAFHRAHPEMEVVMLSKGDPDENRAKVKEHGLSFPVVLQQQWEISRRYALFATPVAYLIDEAGVILREAAVGLEAILALMEARNREGAAAGTSASPRSRRQAAKDAPALSA